MSWFNLELYQFLQYVSHIRVSSGWNEKSTHQKYRITSTNCSANLWVLDMNKFRKTRLLPISFCRHASFHFAVLGLITWRFIWLITRKGIKQKAFCYEVRNNTESTKDFPKWLNIADQQHVVNGYVNN